MAEDNAKGDIVFHKINGLDQESANNYNYPGAKCNPSPDFLQTIYWNTATPFV